MNNEWRHKMFYYSGTMYMRRAIWGDAQNQQYYQLSVASFDKSYWRWHFPIINENDAQLLNAILI